MNPGKITRFAGVYPVYAIRHGNPRPQPVQAQRYQPQPVPITQPHNPYREMLGVCASVVRAKFLDVVPNPEGHLVCLTHQDAEQWYSLSSKRNETGLNAFWASRLATGYLLLHRPTPGQNAQLVKLTPKQWKALQASQ